MQCGYCIGIGTRHIGDGEPKKKKCDNVVEAVRSSNVAQKKDRIWKITEFISR